MRKFKIIYKILIADDYEEIVPYKVGELPYADY
jgi:hypothetical protein